MRYLKWILSQRASTPYNIMPQSADLQVYALDESQLDMHNRCSGWYDLTVQQKSQTTGTLSEAAARLETTVCISMQESFCSSLLGFFFLLLLFFKLCDICGINRQDFSLGVLNEKKNNMEKAELCLAWQSKTQSQGEVKLPLSADLLNQSDALFLFGNYRAPSALPVEERAVSAFIFLSGHAFWIYSLVSLLRDTCMEETYRALSLSDPLQQVYCPFCVRQTILRPDTHSAWSGELWVTSAHAFPPVGRKLADSRETFRWFSFSTGWSVQLEVAFATASSLQSTSKILSHRY